MLFYSVFNFFLGLACGFLVLTISLIICSLMILFALGLVNGATPSPKKGTQR